jgi:hypothetical protein
VSTSLEDRLRTELREDAADVELRPGYVAATVATVLARRRRRQRRTLLAAVVVAAVATAGGVALGSDTDSGTDGRTIDEPLPQLPDRTAPPLDPRDLQKGPTPADVSTLPWRDTALPRVLPVDVVTAPVLSEDPIQHALALVGGPGATVGVVGDDGRLRRLDGVSLVPTRDPDGYRASPVVHGSLTSDGTIAAFPQPGAVVVVDLAQADSERYDIPGLGFNTRVAWHPDGHRILIGREGESSAVLDTADGSVEEVRYDARLTAYAPDGTAVEIRPNSNGVTSELVRWSEASLTVWLQLSTDNEWAPSATDHHLLVAASGDQLVRTTPRYDTGWVVVDTMTGRSVAMLSAGTLPYDDWLFGFHGWIDADTAIIQAHDFLIAWTPDTGRLERLTQMASYEVSLATDALE